MKKLVTDLVLNIEQDFQSPEDLDVLMPNAIADSEEGKCTPVTRLETLILLLMEKFTEQDVPPSTHLFHTALARVGIPGITKEKVGLATLSLVDKGILEAYKRA